MARRTPYKLIDSVINEIVCNYASLSIALVYCGRKNKEAGEIRFYVERLNGSKITAKE
jgi:hypothetical protein